MPRKIAMTSLQGRTIDILNTIRANASAEYQNTVPKVETEHDIPAVGQVIYGYPAIANQFISALVNRIALVNIKSATFYNDYANLKKGYLEFGESVEEVFVNIAKARVFSPEKAEGRELKRSLPDVRTAFHTMNWRVQYPVTIQDEDLRQAFVNIDGVTDLIAKITDSVYTAAEYDEYLLFKYMIIKAITSGKMKAVAVDPSTDDNWAEAFRGTSNLLPFPSTEFNESGVLTTTPKEDQYIFMDARFNAKFDVKVLARSFNMDKADFIGKLKVVDKWDSFDSDRFSNIQNESDMLPPVTEEELSLMKNVKAVLVDAEWFQVYDLNNKFTEKYVSSGMYWNYFYNIWKTISHSPFSNAVVFVEATANVELPATLDVTLSTKVSSDDTTIFTFDVETSSKADKAGLFDRSYSFVQTAPLTEAGIAVQKYGAVIIPASQVGTDINLQLEIGGTIYNAATSITSAADVGEVVVMNKAE